MAELLPGVFTEILTRLGARAEAATVAVLEPLAAAVERQAKINASSGEHRRGTPTPARPGSGPARISGTLVRSITHTRPERGPHGWEVRVGTGVGLYPPYGRHTPSSRYGYYLEHGLRNGARYPFLGPAAHMVTHITAHSVVADAFRTVRWI